MNDRNLVVEEIGNVLMVKSKRAKYVSISIKPFRGVKVSVPYRVSYEEAEQILRKRIGWIKDHLPKIAQIEQQRTVFDERSEFRTRDHQLNVTSHFSDQFLIRVFPGTIQVNYPHQVSVYEQEVQDAIRKGIEEAWRIEAKKFLVQRTIELAREHQLEFNRIAIKNNRSRWGSCSAKDNINLTLHLMRIDDHLIDYIILHELAHTIVKDHSSRFWLVLEQICPNCKKLDKEMNSWSLTIY